MNKFELPYNFNVDERYFDLLDNYKNNFQQIDCIYMPAFEKHIVNTRKSGTILPKTEEKYILHLNEFKKRNLNITILMQRGATFEDIEKYYLKYGINDFTINDNNLAKSIKEKYFNIKLRLSITAKASPEDITSGNLDMYDNIVLFFWYNRHLDVIKSLPNKFKYTILCNTKCMFNCPYCEQHWFEDRGGNCGKERFIGRKLNFPNSAYIRPEDIKYFEVSVFKIEGRELSSKIIFEDFDSYLNEKSNFNRLYGFNKENIISNYNEFISKTKE